MLTFQTQDPKTNFMRQTGDNAVQDRIKRYLYEFSKPKRSKRSKKKSKKKSKKF